MKKHSIHALATIALLWVAQLMPTHGTELPVTMKPPQGWVLEQPNKSAGPEIVFLTPKGRDACFIISHVERFTPSADKGESLKRRHVWWYKQQRKSEPERDNLEKFSTDNGNYLISTFEDPKLVGKPVELGNYKYTIHITGVVDDERFVVCGLLTNEKDGKDLKEVKLALRKLEAK